MPTVSEAIAIALQHHRAGRLDVAEEIYQRILAVEPDAASVWHLFGLAAHARGQYAMAVERIARAVNLAPSDPQFLNSLGEAYRGLGNVSEAAACYRTALERKADFAEAHCNLGIVLQAEGGLDEAAAHMREAIALKPDLAEAHANLGCILQKQGKLEQAIACHRRALELRPDFANAHNNLGETYRAKGQMELAAGCFRRAMTLAPASPEVHCNLGAVLQRQGRLDEAVECYRRAIALNPADAQSHANLGNAMKDLGRFEEAMASFREALAIDPCFAGAHSDLLYTMYLSPSFDARAIYEEHCRWNRQHAEPLSRFIEPHGNDRTADRRLRVGYVSPDFGENPVGRFLLPLLESHDHRDFEVFGYASVSAPDAMTGRCREAVDRWRDVLPLSDSQLAQAVREDRIDILVELSMHTAGSRLLALARKPAPVQMTYLAYCGTTGLATIDYRLTDPYLDPPGSEDSCYAEQSIRLPETYWCYRPVDSAPPVGPLPAIRNGRVTFGCLNNFCKLSEAALSTWIRVLQAVPDSHLLLHAYAGSARQRIGERFARHGVSTERLEFVDLLPRDEYFRTYRRIDVALDPFPYGGGTTTCDALWMGVPVVSLAGRTAVGRGGLSILSNLALQDLVTSDVDRYVQIAAALAADRARLGQLRATLRERMQRSPLMDAPRFARAVEAAYRTAWRRWCEGQHDD